MQMSFGAKPGGVPVLRSFSNDPAPFRREYASRQGPIDSLSIHPLSNIGEKIKYLNVHILVKSFPGGSVVKNLPANAGDLGLIPESGRSPGEGNGYPL